MMVARERATWRIGRRELVAMLGGVVLYGGLSWLTNVFRLQAADLQIRPGVAVPIVFGFVFGPVVGFVTGAVGNLFVDLMSGLLPYAAVQPTGQAILDFLRYYLLNWQVGNGIMGLIPGLAALAYRRYFTWRDQLRALLIAALGIVVGIGFASLLHMFVDLTVTLDSAIHDYFIPVIRVNLVNAVVLVPIVLYNYERFDLSSLGWLRSGLMRRLSLAILISAALPVALLGLFLTQQTMHSFSTSPAQLWAKLGFTVLITLLFTITNAALLAQSMSRPLLRVTQAAQAMEAGQLSSDQAGDLEATGGADEISRLSQVFGRMAKEVILREERLKKQVEELRIEIDQTKKARQVSEITDTDYFRALRSKAEQLRQRSQKEET